MWAVGATRPQPIDVRIIASTNRDLAGEIDAGRFRADLFYRLNVVHLVLPPLRDRREDIPLLVDHFIRRLNVKLERRVLGAEPEALQALMGHGWKGNVRELEHVLEQAMIMGTATSSASGTCPTTWGAAPRPRARWTSGRPCVSSPATTSSTSSPAPASTSARPPAFSGSAWRRSTGS